MTTIEVFAYGSNLHEPQMRRRCPTAKLVGPATLRGYRLLFSGYSSGWRGAVASIAPDRGAAVPGVVYAVSLDDLLRLDAFEGCPRVYHRARLLVATERMVMRAQVYLQSRRATGRFGPSPRYFNQIWRAYERFGFEVTPLFRAVRRQSP